MARRSIPVLPWPASTSSRSKHIEAARPALAYDANLVEPFRLLIKEVEGVEEEVPAEEVEVVRIADGPGRWAAFGDTVAAGLRKLGRHYHRLVVRAEQRGRGERCAGGGRAVWRGFRFAAVYTAQRIGSYKPSWGNFRFLFDAVRRQFGVDKEKGELLHVARSLTADHVPAKELGLRSERVDCEGRR
ncbi:hypothetical protein VTK56DRAFT_4710 [Thermocarpiscus australiensis]